MLAWLSANAANIIVIALLVLLVYFLIHTMIRDKKAGKSSCGGSCASCGLCSGAKVDPAPAEAVPEEEGEENLIQTIVKVDGMMCGMCEAHVNDAVRKAITVKKVSSSHSKGETVILTEEAPDLDVVRQAIDSTGYTVKDISSAPYEKKGLHKIFG